MARRTSLMVSLALLAVILLGSITLSDAREVINIYTSRHYGVESVFEAFTKETGIMIRFTTGGDAALRDRIKAEGKNTLADIYMASDASFLSLAAKDGLLQPMKSKKIQENIPSNLRDKEGQWIALSKRYRTIFYNPAKVKPEELSTYEALADPKWKGRLILRPSTHPYAQAFVSSLIAVHGGPKAEEILKGLVANTVKYIDSDTKILEAVAAGDGDVAIANSYYMGRILEKNPQFPVKIFWANQDKNDRGTHFNICGAGVTANAINAKNAVKLLEWLSSPKGQKMFADLNHEYPANPKVAPHPILEGFGKFREDRADISSFGSLQADAIKLMEKVGYK